MEQVISARKREIVKQYITELDKHIGDLKDGKAEIVFEIRTFANILHIHPAHLSSTVKEITGKTTCDHFEERLLSLAKEMLTGTSLPVAQIARHLTYDPSNFTKFFKHFTGTTPKKYRDAYTL